MRRRGKHRIYDDAAVPAGLARFLEDAVARCRLADLSA